MPQASLLKLGPHALIPTLDLFDLQALHLRRMDEFANSKWNSRGWTYQEGVVARRRLIFTESLVVFQCLQSKWDERFSCPFPTEASGISGGSEYGVPQFLPHGPIGSDASYFGGHVSEYYGRDFTYLSDQLIAFQGVLQEFASSPAALRNLCAVPAFRFSDKALAPSPPSQAQTKAKRRSRLSQQLKLFMTYTKPRMEPEAATDASALAGFVAGLCWDLETSSSNHASRVEQTSFPSWSWLGWRPPSKDYRVTFPLDLIHMKFLFGDVSKNYDLVVKDVRVGFTSTGRESGVLNDTETNLESALNSQRLDASLLKITTWIFDGQIAESQQSKVGLFANDLRHERAPYMVTMKLHDGLVSERYILVGPRDSGGDSLSARFAVMLSVYDGMFLLCLVLVPCSRHGTGHCFKRIGLVYLDRVLVQKLPVVDEETRKRHSPSSWTGLDEENTLFVESLPSEVCRMGSVYVC